MNKFSLSTLERQLEKINDLIEKREEVFSERSDKWQEGEKGDQHSDRTQELEGIRDDLENAIDALREWNDNANS